MTRTAYRSYENRFSRWTVPYFSSLCRKWLFSLVAWLLKVHWPAGHSNGNACKCISHLILLCGIVEIVPTIRKCAIDERIQYLQNCNPFLKRGSEVLSVSTVFYATQTKICCKDRLYLAGRWYRRENVEKSILYSYVLCMFRNILRFEFNFYSFCLSTLPGRSRVEICHALFERKWGNSLHAWKIDALFLGIKKKKFTINFETFFELNQPAVQILSEHQRDYASHWFINASGLQIRSTWYVPVFFWIKMMYTEDQRCTITIWTVRLKLLLSERNWKAFLNCDAVYFLLWPLSCQNIFLVGDRWERP